MRRHTEKVKRVSFTFNHGDLMRALREKVVRETGEEEFEYANAALKAYTVITLTLEIHE